MDQPDPGPGGPLDGFGYLALMLVLGLGGAIWGVVRAWVHGGRDDKASMRRDARDTDARRQREYDIARLALTRDQREARSREAARRQE